MNVKGQYNPKDVECISVENLEVLPSGADWQSRHLESERRKAEIRDRIHKQAEQGQKTAKDYFRPAKPTPSIYDSDLMESGQVVENPMIGAIPSRNEVQRELDDLLMSM